MLLAITLCSFLSYCVSCLVSVSDSRARTCWPAWYLQPLVRTPWATCVSGDHIRPRSRTTMSMPRRRSRRKSGKVHRQAVRPTGSWMVPIPGPVVLTWEAPCNHTGFRRGWCSGLALSVDYAMNTATVGRHVFIKGFRTPDTYMLLTLLAPPIALSTLDTKPTQPPRRNPVRFTMYPSSTVGACVGTIHRKLTPRSRRPRTDPMDFQPFPDSVRLACSY